MCIHICIIHTLHQSSGDWGTLGRGAALGCAEPGGGLPQRGLRHGRTALQMWRPCRRRDDTGATGWRFQLSHRVVDVVAPQAKLDYTWD